MSYDFEIITDKRWPECCAIETDSWVKAKLGDALPLGDDMGGGWASDESDKIIAHIEALEGAEYVQVARDNVYNSENSFSDVFVYTVFAPAEDANSDWYYSDNVYVTIETHIGGDVRGNYRAYTLHKVDSLADAGFFDWVLGWRVEYANGENADDQGRYGVGYSSHPFYELQRALKGEKLQWSERRQAFLGWLDGRAVACTPSQF